MEVVVSEAEWQAKLYDLLGIKWFMESSAENKMGQFAKTKTGSAGLIDGKRVVYLNNLEDYYYLRLPGGGNVRILSDKDAAKIAYRMCELIPGLRDQLLLWPEVLYCPPIHSPTTSWANFCEKDLMHDFGLKRGAIYPFEILYYKFSEFFDSKKADLGGHQPSQHDKERMENLATKISHLVHVQEAFAAEQAEMARNFVLSATEGEVFTSFMGDPQECLSLGHMGEKGEAVAALFRRLLLLSPVRLPFILCGSLIEPFEIVIKASLLSNRLFWATYRPPAHELLKMIYGALESSPSLSVFFLLDHELSVRNSHTHPLHSFLGFISESVELSGRVEVAWGDPGVCTHPKIFGDGDQVAFLGSGNGSKASLHRNVETLSRMDRDKALFLNQVYFPFLFDQYYITLGNDPLSGKTTEKVKSGYHGKEELPEVTQEILFAAEERLRAVLRNYLHRLDLYSPAAMPASTEPVIPLLRQLAQRVGIELHAMPRGCTATTMDTYNSGLKRFSQIEPFKTLLYSRGTQPAAVVCLTASMGLPAVMELIGYKRENPDTAVVVIADKFNETDFHAMLIRAGILVARCGDNMFHLKIFSSFYGEASDARNYESYGSPNWSPSAMFGPNDGEIGVRRNGAKALSAMTIAAVVVAATFGLSDVLVGAIGGGNMVLDSDSGLK